MAVNPTGTALYILSVDAHGPPELIGIHKRDLNGTWTHPTPTLNSSTWWHGLRITWIGTRMFVAGQGTPNIAYSDDDGVSWTYATSPGISDRIHQFIALDNSLIVAGSSTPYEVYRSIDDGATWSTLLSDATAGNSCQPVIWIHDCLSIATNRMATIDSSGVLTQYALPFVPDKRGRLEILQVHTRALRAEDVDLQRIAEATHGFLGADLNPPLA